MPSPIIVGKVYADWCGHCQTLKPKWEQLKEILPKGRVQTIEIEETETDKRAKFEKKYKKTINMRGYPTIFKMVNGKIEYYSGPREPEDMKRWVLSTPNKKTFRQTRRKSRGKKRTRKSFLNLLSVN